MGCTSATSSSTHAGEADTSRKSATLVARVRSSLPSTAPATSPSRRRASTPSSTPPLGASRAHGGRARRGHQPHGRTRTHARRCALGACLAVPWNGAPGRERMPSQRQARWGPRLPSHPEACHDALRKARDPGGACPASRGPHGRPRRCALAGSRARRATVEALGGGDGHGDPTSPIGGAGRRSPPGPRDF